MCLMASFLSNTSPQQGFFSIPWSLVSCETLDKSAFLGHLLQNERLGLINCYGSTQLLHQFKNEEMAEVKKAELQLYINIKGKRQILQPWTWACSPALNGKRTFKKQSVWKSRRRQIVNLEWFLFPLLHKPLPCKVLWGWGGDIVLSQRKIISQTQSLRVQRH